MILYSHGTMENIKNIIYACFLVTIIYVILASVFMPKDRPVHFSMIHPPTLYWETYANNLTTMSPRGNTCSMQERLRRVRERCDKFERTKYLNNNTRLAHYMHQTERHNVMIDDSRKILYCPIYKVASTAMKVLLMDTAGGDGSIVHTSDDRRRYWRSKGFTFLMEHSSSDIDRIVEAYHSVMVVRHPFDHLLSAYYDKFVADHKFVMQRHLDGVVEKQYKEQLEHDEEGRPRLTLEQFLDIVAQRPDEFKNLHWSKFMENCNPCVFQFKQIIRMESMEDDMKTLLGILTYPNGSHPVLSERNMHRPRTNLLQHVTDAFRNISSDTIDRPMEIYEKDFQIFGYTWDTDNGAGCVDSPGDQICC